MDALTIAKEAKIEVKIWHLVVFTAFAVLMVIILWTTKNTQAKIISAQRKDVNYALDTLWKALEHTLDTNPERASHKTDDDGIQE